MNLEPDDSLKFWFTFRLVRLAHSNLPYRAERALAPRSRRSRISTCYHATFANRLRNQTLQQCPESGSAEQRLTPLVVDSNRVLRPASYPRDHSDFARRDATNASVDRAATTIQTRLLST